MKTTKKNGTKAKSSPRQVAALVSTHAHYFEPKKKVFRILTNGEVMRVQYKTRMGFWKWWNEVRYVMFGTYQTEALFTTRENAIAELKYQYGNIVTIVKEWRAT